jgi:DNA-binding NarL/FixJ family response regulator
MQHEPKIRTYLVEDQNLLRESLRAMLDGDDAIEVVGDAPDAEQAIAELDAIAADVVLMDIRLPGMNGLAATRLLKAKQPKLAVVVLTFYPDEHVTSAIDAGASGYVLKTCTAEDLFRAVRAAHAGLTYIDPAVVTEVVKELARSRKERRSSLLTERQIQILRLIAGGEGHRSISEILFVSERTVNREVRHIFDGLGVNDAAHAVARAYEKGIL